MIFLYTHISLSQGVGLDAFRRTKLCLVLNGYVCQLACTLFREAYLHTRGYHFAHIYSFKYIQMSHHIFWLLFTSIYTDF